MSYSTVLSIDPGRDKCGVAIVARSGVVCREIVRSESLILRLRQMLGEHCIDAVLIGNGTGSEAVRKSIEGAACHTEVVIVEESHSSERARRRYFRENPPRGLRRLIPLGLLFPETAYDDLVAVILAEEYFRTHGI